MREPTDRTNKINFFDLTARELDEKVVSMGLAKFRADQIRDWSARGIEFGAHGRSHANLTELADSDLVLIVTAHPGVDYAAIAARSALFVDLRGVTRGIRSESLIRL